MRFPTIGVLLLLALPSWALGQGARFTPLGDLPGGVVYSFITGVSGDGRVVVGQSDGVNGPEAFRWEDGVMEGLGNLPGGSGSIAWASSGDGAVVVGQGTNEAGDQEAFRWEGGVMDGLGDLPGGTFSSEAYDVSLDGSVVVGAGRPTINNGAFRWEDGVMELLPDIPGGDDNGCAYAVSSDGRIAAGWGTGPPGVGGGTQEAVRWVEGVAEGLGFPAGSDGTAARDMSGDGSVVVGQAHLIPTGFVAFIWREGVGMEYLPELPGGGSYLEAFAISGDGRVVMGPADGANGFDIFVWTEEAGTQSFRDMLEALGVDLTGWFLGTVHRHGISRDGTVIVGSGSNPDGDPEGWRVELPPFPVANAPEAPQSPEWSVSVYPNPVRERAIFRFSIPEEARVTLKIYDVLGREVMKLFDADHEAGSVTLRWNPSNQLGQSLSSGVYLYRLNVGNHVETRTLTVLR